MHNLSATTVRLGATKEDKTYYITIDFNNNQYDIQTSQFNDTVTVKLMLSDVNDVSLVITTDGIYKHGECILEVNGFIRSDELTQLANRIAKLEEALNALKST